MKVATVLRSGGDFRPEHVYAIKRMLNEHLPEHEFVCLTDVESIPPTWRVPLEHRWPGWWAKLELCRPDLTGPLLYLDLDMVVLGDLSPLVADTTRSTCLRDLYRGRRKRKALQSALMLLTEEDRALVWEAWSEDPERWMRRRSDQDVYERVLRDRVRYFQETHPGMVLGYKSHIRGNGGPPEDCRIVVFHGRPRPWQSGETWAVEAFQ